MAYVNRKSSTENENNYDEVGEVSDRNNRETNFGKMLELGNLPDTSTTYDQLTLPLQRNDTSVCCQTNRKAWIFKIGLIVLLMVGTSITTVLLTRSLFSQCCSEMNTTQIRNDLMDMLLTQLDNRIERMTIGKKQLDSKIEHQIKGTSQGATYVRWSKTQCPSDAELVYSGYAGGGRYNEEGSAAEPVCLPKDPEFNKTSGTDTGRMYGAEFDNTFFEPNSIRQDVTCAVCRTTFSTSVIMIPGKTSCHTGWRREYYGYLASGHYNHSSASTYVCVDINPEYVPEGSAWNGLSKLFYEVVAKCGVLKCPPYHDGYPLTCVVCSK